jgi:hypothetical protein
LTIFSLTIFSVGSFGGYTCLVSSFLSSEVGGVIVLAVGEVVVETWGMGGGVNYRG